MHICQIKNPKKCHLFTSVKCSTADFLTQMSKDMGLSKGEIIDKVCDWYVEYCNDQDRIADEATTLSLLADIKATVQRVEKKLNGPDNH